MNKNLGKATIKNSQIKEIISWIQSNGINDKHQFLKKFPENNFKECKFKWKNVWNPKIKKGDWTETEDIKLFISFIKNKGSWSKISKDLKNRTRISTRNRFMNSFKSRSLQPHKQLFRNLILSKTSQEIGNEKFIQF
jgi:hypothetical protein